LRVYLVHSSPPSTPHYRYDADRSCHFCSLTETTNMAQLMLRHQGDDTAEHVAEFRDLMRALGVGLILCIFLWSFAP
jgi:hypothetical protein